MTPARRCPRDSSGGQPAGHPVRPGPHGAWRHRDLRDGPSGPRQHAPGGSGRKGRPLAPPRPGRAPPPARPALRRSGRACRRRSGVRAPRGWRRGAVPRSTPPRRGGHIRRTSPAPRSLPRSAAPSRAGGGHPAPGRDARAWWPASRARRLPAAGRVPGRAGDPSRSRPCRRGRAATAGRAALPSCRTRSRGRMRGRGYASPAPR